MGNSYSRRTNRYSTEKSEKAKEFDERIVEISRVSRTMAGGRRISFRATVVIGNHKGKIGMGIGKSKEVTDAVTKAVKKAQKNLVQVSLVKDTIPYEIYSQYKGAKIFLKPASQGTGIIAGGVIRIVANLVGIKNILSKSLGSANKISNLNATILALQKLSKEAK